MSKKPLIAITMGDPFGIGPELVCKSLADPKIWEACHPLVIGSASPMEKALECTGSPQRLHPVENVTQCDFAHRERIYLVDIPCDFSFAPGEVRAENGAAAMAYMEKANALIMAGKAHGTAGAPCHKGAMKKAGSPFVGATELFGHLAGGVSVSGVTMLGEHCSFNVTNHVSLRDALDSLNSEVILKKILSVFEVMGQMGYDNPRIAVAGINPHAGDGGALGSEEIAFVLPAVKEAQARGVPVTGPIPADFLHIKALQGEFDATISMFHDTKSIGTKMMATILKIPTAVVTVGLPYVRTTVAHGTAYDIAYQNLASHEQMAHCIATAAKLAFSMRRDKTEG